MLRSIHHLFECNLVNRFGTPTNLKPIATSVGGVLRPFFCSKNTLVDSHGLSIGMHSIYLFNGALLIGWL